MTDVFNKPPFGGAIRHPKNTSAETEAEKKYIYPKVDADALVRLLKTHNAKALANKWGFSTSSIRRWALVGKVPQHVDVLCHHELEDKERFSEAPVFALVSIPRPEVDSVVVILEKFGCRVVKVSEEDL